MAWTPYQIGLALLMVVTGSLNTITTKWADKTKANGSDGKERDFDHPFVQAACMFYGEFLCLLVFKIMFWFYSRRSDNSVQQNTITAGSQDFNPFLLFPAAMCDMVGTSLMYVGLNLTSPSSFQMLRGSVIVFVALMSVVFLRRKIELRMWIGIAFVIAGLFVVGLSDFINPSKNQANGDNKAIIGDIIIIVAQVITASQMVYEEKFVSTRNIPPLQAVGWEGLFGLVANCLLLIPFYYIHVPPPFSDNSRGTLDDPVDALHQIINNKILIVALGGTIVSIAFFNFAGISVTKELSATTRMILDSVRTLTVWGFSLAVQWQDFHALQIPGFILLIIGMCVYNDLIPSARTLVAPCNRRTDESLVDAEEGPEHP